MVEEDDRECCPPDVFKRALAKVKTPQELDRNVNWIVNHEFTFSDGQITEVDDKYEQITGCNNE